MSQGIVIDAYKRGVLGKKTCNESYPDLIVYAT